MHAFDLLWCCVCGGIAVHTVHMQSLAHFYCVTVAHRLRYRVATLVGDFAITIYIVFEPLKLYFYVY